MEFGLDKGLVLLQSPFAMKPSWGKGVYALHSHMCALDYLTEPSVSCPDTNAGDAAFVRATRMIGGCDAVEEYLAYGMYPLSAHFGLQEITDDETPVSKLTVPLPEFHEAKAEEESDAQFLAKVELEAENILGTYTCTEHDACIRSLPNGRRLSRVFEMAGVAYAPRPQPGTEASAKAGKRRKADAYGKTTRKRVKVAAKKKATPQVTLPRAKSGLKRPFDAELALAKPVKKTQKFALAPSSVPVSGSGGTGASSSRAPAAHAMKASLPGTAPRVSMISMLGVPSSSESRESSLCDPPSPLSGGAPPLSANQKISSAALDAKASRP
jgi:hypothetical protein